MLLTAPVQAQQYPTIVGSWYAEETGPGDCGTQYEVQIGPMSYAEETFICSFDDVWRDGWQVTWNGACNDGSGRVKTKVVAIEDDGRLSLSFNGDPGWSTLRRCDGKIGSAPVPTIDLDYTTYAAGTAEAQAYWGDAIDMTERLNAELVANVTILVASAAGYKFAYIEGMLVCGSGGHGCPIRVFEDGRQVDEFSVCENPAKHAVASDGSKFIGCGREIELN